MQELISFHPEAIAGHYQPAMKLTFSDRLQASLKRANKSLADVERDTGLSQHRLSKWKNGVVKQPTDLEAVEALARTLSVNAEWLLYGADQSKGGIDEAHLSEVVARTFSWCRRNAPDLLDSPEALSSIIASVYSASVGKNHKDIAAEAALEVAMRGRDT